MSCRVPVLLLLALLLGSLPEVRAENGSGPSAEDTLRDVFGALQRYDRESARAGLDAARAQGLDGDELRLAEAWLLHMDGDHAATVQALERVTQHDDSVVDELRRTAEASARWMEGARELESAHFRLRYPAGVEEVMARPALEVLEAAYESVGEDLGLYPDELTLVEIYPTSAAFAQATGLPPSAMVNDTIALCRWDRLLITSPMAAAFGYPWADTLCHEYTHLIVNRLSAGGVPVWLHEGIAVFEQRRWRGETRLVLDPYEQGALTRAVADDDLVGLGEIGNCLACLEGKDRVRLAFAEVQTMVDYLVRADGMQALRDVIESCRHGADAQVAMAAAHGGSFDEFEADWRAYIVGRGWYDGAGVGVVDLGLDEVTGSDDQVPAEDSLLAGHAGGAGHARLGDLLLDRGQRRAALLEYQRAEALLPLHSPSLACKKAYAYRELGQHEDARRVLQRAREQYPDYQPLAVNLAAAHAALDEPVEALAMYRHAALINPFDPRIYVGQLALLDPQRDRTEYERAREALDTLQRYLRYDGAPREPDSRPETEEAP